MKKDNQFGPQGWTPDRIKTLKGKTYVITGATSGTGFEAAKILASKDAKVVMLNRNPKKSVQVIETIKQALGKEVDLSFITMDLSIQDSIKEATQSVLSQLDRIDALICNGAIAQVPQRKLTVDGYESQLGVNHYGHFTLQALLYPLIEKSSGRIVVVGSLGYNMGLKTINFDDMNWDKKYTGNLAYSQSKLAQIMSVYALQDKLKVAGKKNVKVYACHPGSSRTSLIKTSGSKFMRFSFWLMTKSPLTQSAVLGAYPELMCATEEDLDQEAFYGPTGRSNWVGPVGAHHIEAHAKDKAVAKKLWEISEQATNIKWKF